MREPKTREPKTDGATGRKAREARRFGALAVMFGSEKAGRVQARGGALSMQSLLNSTALLRACLLSAALSAALLATPVFADGGMGTSEGGLPFGAGGADSSTGTGGN